MKKSRRAITAFILLDKPLGLSSNNALQKVKWLFQAKKAGHTGSLDPLATGMLPICFGDATKYAQFLLNSDKRYEVTAKLGVRTDTSDAEGEVVAERPVPVFKEKRLQKWLDQFRGKTEQIPSMYSALKHQGKPLYDYARRGITVPRESRPIEVFELTLLGFTVDSVSLRIHCSKGTYIRTIIDDLGELMGCGAHVTALRRTHIGELPTEMVTLEHLESMSLDERMAQLLNAGDLLLQFPSVTIDDETCFYLRRGQASFIPRLPESNYFRLYDQNAQFVGLAKRDIDGKLAPVRMTFS